MNTNNDVLTLMQTRRSIRDFKPDMVPKDIIDQVITAGTYAATGMNRQSPIIIAVTNKEVRDRLSKLNAEIMGTDSDPFYGAPVVLIVLADKNCINHVYDGSMVMGNLMLAAHSQGIGSCWIHRAKEEFERQEGLEILKSLGIEGEYEGIGHCVLGYVNGEPPKAPERKDNWIYYID
jgi:nitroreductase